MALEVYHVVEGGATLDDVREFLDQCKKSGIPGNALLRGNTTFQFHTDGVRLWKLMADTRVVKPEPPSPGLKSV